MMLLPESGRVLIVRLRSLGDCVLTTPALEILKEARPELEIGVVVEDRFAAVFEGNPAVSAILPPSWRAVLGFGAGLAVNFHGGTRSRWLTLASLARRRAGFAHYRGAWLYNIRLPRAQEVLGEERVVHTAEHLASAMFHLGCPRREIPRARLLAEPPTDGGRYAVIHPVAAMAYKTWPAERFLAVARHVSDRLGVEPVFIGAGRDDLGPFAGYRTVAGAPLRSVMSLLAGASLFVGNDSGPAHMAAALGAPVVVLYGRPGHEVIWAPWRARAARTLSSADGIGSIQAERVLAAIDAVMAG